MKTDTISWYEYTIESLPEILFGHNQNLLASEVNLFEEKVRLGFVNDRNRSAYHPPALMIVDENKVAQVFSWLKVYAQETFPVSQFCRVLSTKDWQQFGTFGVDSQLTTLRFDKWANIILGELLSLADGETDLASLPISRASACFSTAVSKTYSLYLSDSAISTCYERLTFIERDKNFIKRTIEVNDLLPIWELMDFDAVQHRTPSDIAVWVVEVSSKFKKNNLSASSKDSIHIGLYPALFKDSIEDRVLAFNLLANDLSRIYQNDTKSVHANALLAAGAVLVGRGTSHGFLLNKWLNQFRTSFIWFGLIASAMEPKYWDINWSRNIKSIEKYVRTSFDWGELSFSDLSWLEYFWISKTFDGVETINELPKMLSKVLTIEIIPGVTCQLRLNNLSEEKSQAIQKYDKDFIADELQFAMQEVIAAAEKIKGYLAMNNKNSEQLRVQDFSLQKTQEPKSKIVPRRKNKP